MDTQDMIIETKRLYMREMAQSDYNALGKMLKDGAVMYAYNGAFNDEETQEWLDRQLARYEEYKHKFGLWALVLKENGKMIGQCGLTLQQWKDKQVLEIGYLLQKNYWHNGYATEAATACKKYAFKELNTNEVCSIIRSNNTASQKVALRNGMIAVDEWTKHYRGVDMPHILYTVKRI